MVPAPCACAPVVANPIDRSDPAFVLSSQAAASRGEVLTQRPVTAPLTEDHPPPSSGPSSVVRPCLCLHPTEGDRHLTSRRSLPERRQRLMLLWPVGGATAHTPKITHPSAAAPLDAGCAPISDGTPPNETIDHIAGIAVRHPEMVAVGGHYGITVATCVPADPESKGGSEATVRIAKADLVPTDANLRGDYTSWAELAEACEAWMAEVNGRQHRVTRRAPVEMLAEEQHRLHALPEAPYTAVLGETRRLPTSRRTAPKRRQRLALLWLGQTRSTAEQPHTPDFEALGGPILAFRCCFRVCRPLSQTPNLGSGRQKSFQRKKSWAIH